MLAGVEAADDGGALTSGRRDAEHIGHAVTNASAWDQCYNFQFCRLWPLWGRKFTVYLKSKVMKPFMLKLQANTRGPFYTICSSGLSDEIWPPGSNFNPVGCAHIYVKRNSERKFSLPEANLT
jgi:hypothetical protein